MLAHVVNLIEKAVPSRPTYQDKADLMFNSMFSPEAYHAFEEEQRKRQELNRKLVLGVTAAAVAGEVIHLANKHSSTLKRLVKR